MTARDNPPAFPTLGHNYGMSLRDWFAGQALAGLLANERRKITNAMEAAADAYITADAMLAAREKEKPDAE